MQEGAQAVLVGPQFGRRRQRGTGASHGTQACRAGQQLAQRTVAGEVGHEEVDVDRFPVLAVAHRYRSAAAKPAGVGAASTSASSAASTAAMRRWCPRSNKQPPSTKLVGPATGSACAHRNVRLPRSRWRQLRS